MIISVSRSGGFAGIEEELGTIDTDSMTGSVAESIKNNIAEMTKIITEAGGQSIFGTDMFSYEIKIVDDQGERHSLQIIDDGDPDSRLTTTLYELLEVLGVSP